MHRDSRIDFRLRQKRISYLEACQGAPKAPWGNAPTGLQGRSFISNSFGACQPARNRFRIVCPFARCPTAKARGGGGGSSRRLTDRGWKPLPHGRPRNKAKALSRKPLNRIKYLPIQRIRPCPVRPWTRLSVGLLSHGNSAGGRSSRLESRSHRLAGRPGDGGK